ncbi:MAG: Crp/Fnr family transcriptional regulator [Bradymonadaceae bacterium]
MDTFEIVQLFTKIDAAIDQREPEQALQLIWANFGHLSDPAPLRERTARVLAAGEALELAVEIFENVGLHYGHSGQPARALAAAKRIEDLGHDNTGLVDRLVKLYNRQSPLLDPEIGHRTFEAPTTELVTEAEASDAPSDNLVEAAAERALETGYFAEAPDERLPPIPLLSQLNAEQLREVVDTLDYRTFSDLVPVVEPSTHGGELIWTVSSDLTIGEQDPEYRLVPGTLLGLNAYGQSPTPTGRAVYARSGSEILSLSAEAIRGIIEQFPVVRDRLVELSRDAFLEGLLDHHRLFQSVADGGRESLLEQFQGLEISPGTRLIDQNTTSPGLFLILDGEVDIVREDDDWEITIDSLGPGAVFGEVGLVSDQPTQANVEMTKPGHLLHLPSRDFDAVASDYPGIAKYAVNLAQQRMDELETTLSASDLAEISE